MPLYTEQITFKTTDGVLPIGSATIAANGLNGINPTVLAGTIDLPFTITLDPDPLKMQALIAVASQPMRCRLGGTNAQQTISMAGPPTAGTFPLTLGAGTTPGLAWNITAPQMQVALQALSTIGVNNCVCTGGPLPGTPIVVTFTYDKGAQVIAAMTTSSASLTGGTVAVGATTTGVAAIHTFNFPAGDFLYWNIQNAFFANPVPSLTATVYVSNVSGATGTFSLSNYTN